MGHCCVSSGADHDSAALGCDTWGAKPEKPRWKPKKPRTCDTHPLTRPRRWWAQSTQTHCDCCLRQRPEIWPRRPCAGNCFCSPFETLTLCSTPSMNALKRVRNIGSGEKLKTTANLLEGPVSTFKELETDVVTKTPVALE